MKSIKRHANLLENTTDSGPSSIAKGDGYDSICDLLPEEVLEVIFTKLWTGDRVRLRLVCKLWNNILIQSRIPTAPEAPWEILSDDSYNNPQSYLTRLCLRSLSEERTYWFEFPMLSELDNNRGWLCAHSRGWLVLAMGPNMNPFIVLWNPLSGATRTLPPLSTLPFYADLKNSDPLGLKIENFTSVIIRVEIFTVGSVECVVAALFRTSRGNRIALCTPSDIMWTPCNFEVEPVEEEGEVHIHFTDILFHSEGKLIALAKNPFSTDIGTENFLSTKFEISLMGCKVEVVPFVAEPDEVFPTEAIPSGLGIVTRSITNWYMVESSILHIVALICTKQEVLSGKGLIPEFDCAQTTEMSLFSSQLIPYEKEAIFFGATGSFTLPIVHGIVPGCIYFATDNTFGVVGRGDSEIPYIVRERGRFFYTLPNYGMDRYPSRSTKYSCRSKIGWFMPRLFMC